MWDKPMAIIHHGPWATTITTITKKRPTSQPATLTSTLEDA